MAHKLKHLIIRLTDPKQPQFGLSCDFIPISNLQLLISEKLIYCEISWVSARRNRTQTQMLFQKLIHIALNGEKQSFEVHFVLSKSQKSGQSINSVSSQFICTSSKIGVYSIKVHKTYTCLQLLCVFIILFGDMMALIIQQGLKFSLLGDTKEKEQKHHSVISNVVLIKGELMD